MAKKNTKQTSSAVASMASAILRGTKYNPICKSVAASALAQAHLKKKK